MDQRTHDVEEDVKHILQTRLELGEKIDTMQRQVEATVESTKMAALDALRTGGIPLSVNLKFFFEGEEEAGSPNLERILADNKALFAADIWLFCDGPVHQNRQQQITFGSRGVVGLNLTVYGARRELHSGHYGNWAPNPAMLLAQLLATMKDSTGRVLIKDFYEGIVPLNEAEKRAIAEAPNFDAQLRDD